MECTQKKNRFNRLFDTIKKWKEKTKKIFIIF